MNISSLSGLSGSHIHSLFGAARTRFGHGTSGSQTNGIAAGLTMPQDEQQLSPFAQMLTTLQKLQQTDTTKYRQVAQEIAMDLQKASASVDPADQDTANQLYRLSADFSQAAQTGQLPDIQDLATAFTSGLQHHRHQQASLSSDALGDGSSASSSIASGGNSTSATSNIRQLFSQLLAALHARSNGSESLNPTSIIFNALSNAGVTVNR